jgi:hypothetical protein
MLMRYFKVLLPILICFVSSGYGRSQAPLPQIRQDGTVKRLYVDDKPYIMLAGELHNSSASSPEYMKPIW